MKRIQINHLGYMTGVPKTAVCRVASDVFYLVDADNGMNVYAGRLSHSFYDRESGDTVRIADFSDFNEKGRYFIRTGYRRSDVFEISDVPYRSIRRDIISSIYLNRCGFDYYEDLFDGRVMAEYLRHDCHTDPVPLEGNPNITRDVKGGWHSVGGYNRNVMEAGITTAYMICSLLLFSESFELKEKRLFEDEIRWGLDWLLKMQDTDGAVFSGVYTEDAKYVVSPTEDGREYRIGKKTCRATLRFIAVAALAACYYLSSDPEYSALLSRAAGLGWLSVINTPEYDYYTGRNGNFSEDGEGGYSLESEFMWALCEMYALTGNESFSEMIEKKYSISSFTGFGNGGCGAFAALSYFLSTQKKSNPVQTFIRKRVTDHADRLCIALQQSGYHIAVNAGGGYTFGSNYKVLTDCMSFIAAYLISGAQKYLLGATEQLSYIYGKNPLGKCYVTGHEPDFVKRPCHMLSLCFDNTPAISGMVVSGPCTDYRDNYTKWHLEKDSSPAKSYLDTEYSRSTNMASVHYSAPVIFISAFYDKVGRSAFSRLRKSEFEFTPNFAR